MSIQAMKQPSNVAAGSYLQVQWLGQVVKVLLQLSSLAPAIGSQVCVLQALKSNVVIPLPMPYKMYNLTNKQRTL